MYSPSLFIDRCMKNLRVNFSTMSVDSTPAACYWPWAPPPITVYRRCSNHRQRYGLSGNMAELAAQPHYGQGRRNLRPRQRRLFQKKNSTYFICLTMVLLPDSPPPKGNREQSESRSSLGDMTSGPRRALAAPARLSAIYININRTVQNGQPPL